MRLMKQIYKTFIVIVLTLAILQSFILILIASKVLYSYSRPAEFTGKASGFVKFCINTAPGINLTNCSNSTSQDIHYSCWINKSDPDQVNLTYTSVFREAHRACNTSTEGFFNVTNEGRLDFTPRNNDVGNYTIEFTVDDGMGCANSVNSTYLSLKVANVNDPPYLIKPIPDQSLHLGEVLHAFYLSDYFADPDCADYLTYSLILLSSDFNVQLNNLTGEVVMSTNTCDITGYAMFIAKDPHNATGSSNLVVLRCTTPTPATQTGAGKGTGSGGGGGTTAKCIPEYECFDYYKCRQNNTKIQKCVDAKGCDDDKFLTVPCQYEEAAVCTESWNCSEWEKCFSNGTQSRECLDENNCGTDKTKPLLTQACEYIGTCDDGIKNCHDGSCEEEIDCGGPCSPCKSIQVPYPFVEEKGMLVYIITGIILVLLAAVLLYHYFHKEINAAIAKAGWLITRRKKKQILLSIEDKKKLLAGLLAVEKKIDSIPLPDILNKYAELLRYYIIKVCGEKNGLSSAFYLDELKAVLEKRKGRVIESLRKIFVSLFDKYVKVEQSKALVNKKNISLLIEELRNLVLQTSKVEPEDAARELKELAVPEKANSMDKIIIRIRNAYIALEFLEIEVAKKKYLELLTDYEKLNVKDQEAIFEDIARLYNNVAYVNSWLEKPKEE